MASSTGLKQTVQMTDEVFASTSWYIIVNIDDQNAQSRLQLISEQILTHQTKPVTILNKIDYCVSHRFESAIVSTMEKSQSFCVTSSSNRSKRARSIQYVSRKEKELATNLLLTSNSSFIRRHLAP
jgi:GTPase Era involved in 16S rRNA processing